MIPAAPSRSGDARCRSPTAQFVTGSNGSPSPQTGRDRGPLSGPDLRQRTSLGRQRQRSGTAQTPARHEAFRRRAGTAIVGAKELEPSRRGQAASGRGPGAGRRHATARSWTPRRSSAATTSSTLRRLAEAVGLLGEPAPGGDRRPRRGRDPRDRRVLTTWRGPTRARPPNPRGSRLKRRVRSSAASRRTGRPPGPGRGSGCDAAGATSR